MDEWCFVHAADLHLDTPFTGIARIDPDLAALLRDASLAAFDALIELTLERDAAVLLLAGDVYDGAERGIRAQLAVHRGLERLGRAGTATCIVAGNHDPLDGWSAIERWPPLVTTFGADVPGVVEVTRDGRLLAVVTGISYAHRAEQRNLAALLRRTTANVPHLGLLHANVGGDPDHAAYAPCTVDDLRRGGMDYWALGHIHRRQIVLDGRDGGPWAVYPGNLQGRSPKPSERGAKGAIVGHVRGGDIVEVEQVTLDRARFDEVRTAVGAGDDLATLHRALVAAARDAAADADGRVLVLRGVVTGHGPLIAQLARPGVVDELLDDLVAAAPVDPPTAWTALTLRPDPPSATSGATPATATPVHAAGVAEQLAAVVADARADPAGWAPAGSPLELVDPTTAGPAPAPNHARIDAAAAVARAALERDLP